MLEEILSSQNEHPGEPHFLQPYYYQAYRPLKDSPPSPENPIILYASISKDLKHVSHMAEIIGWEDKTAMSSERKATVDKLIRDLQPEEKGFNEGGRTATDKPSVNLLTIRNLEKQEPQFSITELIKDRDGTPLKPRMQPGGFSYIRRRVEPRFVTELDVDDAAKIATTAGQFDPYNIEDARQKVAASIARRRGQPEFRRKLLVAYQGRCAITGFDAKQALEAAHIHPYRGEQTNHLQNGLLLRADIHSLFDLGLVGVDPSTREVIVRAELQNTQYAQLAGKKVHIPEDPDDRPSSELLQMHLQHARDNSW